MCNTFNGFDYAAFQVISFNLYLKVVFYKSDMLFDGSKSTHAYDTNQCTSTHWRM